MSYPESELDSNFAINSESDFDPSSESNSKSDSESDSVSESDFSSVFMNLDICIPLNKPADGFLSILITKSIVTQAM